MTIRDGRVGAEVGVVFDPGQVSASARFDASAALPDRFTIAAGTPFNICAFRADSHHSGS